ncbi:metallophosphoesterase [Lysinibacillus xylanilyticus]|uniref:metallophosphoesterase n=1 Tax=Lysinibacillus xylanilyticus TaxID=582475 RepID=UPI0036DD9F94
MESVSTEKVAHFNIADVHAFHSLANRYDYNAEVLGIIERVGRVVYKYKMQGYKCMSLLNGDVAHRGSTKDDLNDYATQAIKLLLSYFDENYLNFGNHEFSYFKNNPIFKFINKIEDPRILANYPHLKCSSLVEDLRVVPILEYEDFEIVFTPYGYLPVRGSKPISHLVMHDDLLSDHAYNKLSTEMPEYKIKRKFVNQNEFDYIYCGHNHMIRETWQYGKTTVYNLSSLGRSNVNEVDDSFRHRIIPVILSEDGYFKEVVDEAITLHKREDIVDEAKLEQSRVAYAASKERNEVRESLTISQTRNPIQALEEDISIAENPNLNVILDILKQGRLVQYGEVKIRVEE